MKLAVIRIRGLTGIKSGIKRTLAMLRLYKGNTCAVLEKTASTDGMLRKAKDYVTWGEVNEETLKKLIQKRGKEYRGREKDRKGVITYKVLEANGRKLRPFFTLSPPKGGFERKGIKRPFSEGGALGYRGEKINELISRMI